LHPLMCVRMLCVHAAHHRVLIPTLRAIAEWITASLDGASRGHDHYGLSVPLAAKVLTNIFGSRPYYGEETAVIANGWNELSLAVAPVLVRAALRLVGTGNTSGLEALGTVCVKFKGAAALASDTLTPADMVKLLSDCEGVWDSDPCDESSALLCFQLLSSLVRVRPPVPLFLPLLPSSHPVTINQDHPLLLFRCSCGFVFAGYLLLCAVFFWQGSAAGLDKLVDAGLVELALRQARTQVLDTSPTQTDSTLAAAALDLCAALSRQFDKPDQPGGAASAACVAALAAGGGTGLLSAALDRFNAGHSTALMAATAGAALPIAVSVAAAQAANGGPGLTPESEELVGVVGGLVRVMGTSPAYVASPACTHAVLMVVNTLCGCVLSVCVCVYVCACV
jgi:hypothetical protein